MLFRLLFHINQGRIFSKKKTEGYKNIDTHDGESQD